MLYLVVLLNSLDVFDIDFVHNIHYKDTPTYA